MRVLIVPRVGPALAAWGCAISAAAWRTPCSTSSSRSLTEASQSGVEAVLSIPDVENEDIVVTVERGHGYSFGTASRLLRRSRVQKVQP